MTFAGGTAAAELLAAVEILRALNASGAPGAGDVQLGPTGYRPLRASDTLF